MSGERLPAAVLGANIVIEYPSHNAAMAAIEGEPLCFDARHAAIPGEAEGLRADIEWALAWAPKFDESDHGIDPDRYRAIKARIAALAALAASQDGGKPE